MAIESTGTKSRARLVIVGMIFVAVVINYLDRSNISITVPEMKKAFGFDNRQMGLVLSGFGWSYAAFQICGGWLADRIAPRFLYPAILILWSVCTGLLGTAGLVVGSSITALFLLRLAVGALEAPAYSINNQVTTAWFPDKERAGATGFYISGQFVGIAFLTPLLFWIQEAFDWRHVFYFTGGLGIFWGLVWLVVYRSPRKFRGANAAEIAQIEAGGAMVDLGHANAPKLPLIPTLAAIAFGLSLMVLVEGLIWFVIWAPTEPDRSLVGMVAILLAALVLLLVALVRFAIRKSGKYRGTPEAATGTFAKVLLAVVDVLEVFRWRKLWGIYIGQFSVTTAQWFFLTWFPTYLKEYRHFDYSQLGISVGLATSLPFVGAFLGVLFSGFVSDLILRSGASMGVARKTPIVTGLLLSSSIIGANFVTGPWAVIGFMTLAFFGNGMASIGWSLISSVTPRRLIGLTGGTFNGISNLSGIATPLIIGTLAANGNFAPGLVYVASVALIGACSYIFVIGKIEPVSS
jgi:MFS family permease